MNKFIKRILKVALVIFLILNVIVICHAFKFTHFYDRESAAENAPVEKSGWGKVKEIFLGINAYKQANIAPDSNFSKVILTTKDKIKLEGWEFLVQNPKGTVLLFHGHGSKKSAVLNEGYAFNQLGYNTLLLDFRAHGNSGGNTTTIGFKEAEDVKLAYDFVKNKGEKNIILWGISMGAATITKSIDEYQLNPSKVILEMPFGTLHDAVQGRVKMMGLPAEPISNLLTFWGGTIHGFWAFNFKPEKYVASIKCPVLLQWGKLDPRVTEAETNAVYKNIITPKTFVVYENSGHESLYSKEPTKWMKSVSAFLQ